MYAKLKNPNTDIGVNASNVVPSSSKDAIVQVMHAAENATGVMYSHIGAQVRKDFPTRRYTHIVAAPARAIMSPSTVISSWLH